MDMKCANSDTFGSSIPDGFLYSVNLQHQYLLQQCSQQLVSFWMADDWCWQGQ